MNEKEEKMKKYLKALFVDHLTIRDLFIKFRPSKEEIDELIKIKQEIDPKFNDLVKFAINLKLYKSKTKLKEEIQEHINKNKDLIIPEYLFHGVIFKAKEIKDVKKILKKREGEVK